MKKLNYAKMTKKELIRHIELLNARIKYEEKQSNRRSDFIKELCDIIDNLRKLS